MEKYFGFISGCESIGKPLSVECQTHGFGKFSKLAEQISGDVLKEMKDKGICVFETSYCAAISEKGDIHYKDEKGFKTSEVHEKIHLKVKEQGLGNQNDYAGLSYSYYEILNESIATAAEDFGLLALLKKGSNKEAIEDAKKKIGIKKSFGTEVVELCQKVQNSPNPHSLEQKVDELAKNSFYEHKTKNWASLLNDVKYLGLYKVCFDILNKTDEKDDQGNTIIDISTFLKAFYRLRKNEEPDTCLEHLQKELGTGETIPKIKAIIEKKVMRGNLMYGREDSNKIQVAFFSPKGIKGNDQYEFLKEIKDKIHANYKNEFETLGNFMMDIWADQIIIR